MNGRAGKHGWKGPSRRISALNFKTPEKPEYVGTVANKNPWETLHKVRNGQPGAPMPALMALDIKDQVDVAAHAQNLLDRVLATGACAWAGLPSLLRFLSLISG